MSVAEEIKQLVADLNPELTEKKGVYTLECLVAERKGFLSRKKLMYQARFRIDDATKEVRFTEMLKEAGWGLSSGDADTSPGFGFKKETYKSGLGGREGTMEEQSRLFGDKYEYKWDLGRIRREVEAKAKEQGYTFTYVITGVGL